MIATEELLAGRQRFAQQRLGGVVIALVIEQIAKVIQRVSDLAVGWAVERSARGEHVAEERVGGGVVAGGDVEVGEVEKCGGLHFGGAGVGRREVRAMLVNDGGRFI